jgi:hypothetical protein
LQQASLHVQLAQFLVHGGSKSRLSLGGFVQRTQFAPLLVEKCLELGVDPP